MEQTVSPAVEASQRAAEANRGAVAALLEVVETDLAAHRYVEVAAAVADVQLPFFSAPDLALRLLLAEGRALLSLGRLDQAEGALERARDLSEAPAFGDLERAEVLYRLACQRVSSGRGANAVGLLGAALDLAERAGAPGLAVRSGAHEQRARCYALVRDWKAARADAERALELAEQIPDAGLAASAAMQCSVVVARCGDRLLARYYAELGRDLAVEAGDRETEARLLDTLGGLSFLLGDPDAAVAHLKAAFALSLELGNDADAARAVSSLAQVHLRRGVPRLAEEQARHALSILAERADYADEVGNVRLVLGRALLEQHRVAEAAAEFDAAEHAFARNGSASLLAASWVAQGDAAQAAGDVAAAAELYRGAANTLQDVRF